MTYATKARMAEDIDLINRFIACAASLGIEKPVGWVHTATWELASGEGMDTAYESSADDRPGLDEDAVTDAMLLEAVQSRLAAIAPPEQIGEANGN